MITSDIIQFKRVGSKREQGTHKPLVPSSNLGVATESDDTPFEGVAMIANTQARIVTPVTWLAAPEWLTVDEACHLSGRDRGTLLFWVSDGDVDTNIDGLIALDVDVYFIKQKPPAAHSVIERAHQTINQQAVAGQVFADGSALQQSLDECLDFLNPRFPSRSLDGQPPLVAHPVARHSGQPYRPVGMKEKPV